MREEFEAWSANHEYLGGVEIDRAISGNYSDVDLHHAWEAWHASREALVIDLPSVGPSPEAPEEAIDDSYMDGHYGAIRMRNACFKAITALGLKVKS